MGIFYFITLSFFTTLYNLSLERTRNSVLNVITSPFFAFSVFPTPSTIIPSTIISCEPVVGPCIKTLSPTERSKASIINSETLDFG